MARVTLRQMTNLIWRCNRCGWWCDVDTNDRGVDEAAAHETSCRGEVRIAAAPFRIEAVIETVPPET